MTKQNKLKFRKQMMSLMEKYGATPTGGTSYRIETSLGTLNLTAYYHAEIRGSLPWIATRFDDVDIAAKKLGWEMNTYSGKWNFHFSKGWTPDCCVDEFERNLKRVL